MAGFQVPNTPFGDKVLKDGAVEFAQNAGIAAKLGTIIGFTVTVSVCVVAHCPAFGVKT